MEVARRLALLAGCLLAARLGFAGEPAQLTISQSSVSLPVIKVYARIADSADHLASSVGTSEISATLGDRILKTTAVQPFETSGEGVAYIFLIDISKSIQPSQFDEIRNAVKTWIGGFNRNDRAALLTVGENVDVLSDFTSDPQALASKLDSLSPRDNKTLLHEALSRALDLERRSEPGLPTRRVIVVLSDGKDEGSGLKDEDVVQKIGQDRLPIYAIGSSRLPASERRHYLDVLKRFSRLSGGLYVETGSTPLRQIYADMNRAIRQVYVITLQCEKCPQDGRPYPLRLNLTENGKVLNSDDISVVLVPAALPPPQAPLPPWWRRKLPLWSYAVIALLVIAAIVAVLVASSRRRKAVHLAEGSNAGSPGLAEGAKQAPGTRGFPIRFAMVSGKDATLPRQLRLADRLVIGRNKDCDLVLANDDMVSGRHCQIESIEGKVVLRDLQSQNGTELNGVPVTARCRLQTGDCILLGHTQLRVTFEEPE
jgi:VWFA-related protein